jgi:hypothetical protein
MILPPARRQRKNPRHVIDLPVGAHDPEQHRRDAVASVAGAGPRELLGATRRGWQRSVGAGAYSGLIPARTGRRSELRTRSPDLHIVTCRLGDPGRRGRS